MQDLEIDQVYKNTVSGKGKYGLVEQKTTYQPTMGQAKA